MSKTTKPANRLIAALPVKKHTRIFPERAEKSLTNTELTQPIIGRVSASMLSTKLTFIGGN